MALKRTIKHAWQRATRGFDDSETWNLDYQISDFILPRLQRFKEIAQAYPSCFDSIEQWHEQLDKMILAFKMMTDEDNDFQFDEQAEEIIQEGLAAFTKYYRGLWW